MARFTTLPSRIRSDWGGHLDQFGPSKYSRRAESSPAGPQSTPVEIGALPDDREFSGPGGAARLHPHEVHARSEVRRRESRPVAPRLELAADGCLHRPSQEVIHRNLHRHGVGESEVKRRVLSGGVGEGRAKGDLFGGVKLDARPVGSVGGAGRVYVLEAIAQRVDCVRRVLVGELVGLGPGRRALGESALDGPDSFPLGPSGPALDVEAGVVDLGGCVPGQADARFGGLGRKIDDLRGARLGGKTEGKPGVVGGIDGAGPLGELERVGRLT